MANPILAQILQSALRSRNPVPSQQSPGLGGGVGGAALGGILAGMLGRGRGGPSGNRTVLMAMLLPLAMRWVQRNGGIGAVLERFRRQGLGTQADSWVARGPNSGISPQDVRSVVGAQELSALSSQLGVPEQEVAETFSEVLPELTDNLTPDGHVPPDADQKLAHGTNALEEALDELHEQMQQMP